MRPLLIALALVALIGLPAAADTMYSYTGAPYTVISGTGYTREMFLSGVFVVLEPLSSHTFSLPATGLLHWRFTDGVKTFDPSNSTFTMGRVYIPPGDTVIGAAAFGATRTDGDFGNFWLDSDVVMSDVVRTGESTGGVWYDAPPGLANVPQPSRPASWSTTHAVPEPMTILLVGVGLAGLVGARRAQWLCERVIEVGEKR